MLRLAVLAVVPVALVVLAGCGGGQDVIDLGGNTIIEPPVGTTATTPLVSKFGPIANYLPPSGTVITYKVAGLLRLDSQVIKVKFAAYDNSLGTMTLEVWSYVGGVEETHVKVIGTIKVIGGQSYCVRRKKVFLDEVRDPEITTFTPGVLMGLFDSTVLSKSCSFTCTGHSTGSHSFIMKYKGTATVSAGGTNYNCVISECAGFMPGDISGFQVYWAPGAGPIMATLTPAIRLTQTTTLRLPRWAQLGALHAESVVADSR